MPGTAKLPTFTNIWQGPALIFIDVALPADGTRMTIFTDGTPDATANPNAKWLGTTKAGCKFTASNQVEAYYTDEFATPFRRTITQEDAVLEGEFAELLDFARLIKLLPNALRSSGVGFDQIKSGGLSTFTTMPIAVIGPTIADPTKFAVLQLYSGFSSGGLVLNIERKNPNFSPFKFEGQAVSGRTAGDQLWTFWQQA